MLYRLNDNNRHCKKEDMMRKLQSQHVGTDRNSSLRWCSYKGKLGLRLSWAIISTKSSCTTFERQNWKRSEGCCRAQWKHKEYADPVKQRFHCFQGIRVLFVPGHGLDNNQHNICIVQLGLPIRDIVQLLSSSTQLKQFQSCPREDNLFQLWTEQVCTWRSAADCLPLCQSLSPYPCAALCAAAMKYRQLGPAHFCSRDHLAKPQHDPARLFHRSV